MNALTKEHIRKHEGVRNDIYLDHRGIPTFGVGNALGKINRNQLVMKNLLDINSNIFQGMDVSFPENVFQKLKNYEKIGNEYARNNPELSEKDITKKRQNIFKKENINHKFTNNEVEEVFDKRLNDLIDKSNKECQKYLPKGKRLTDYDETQQNIIYDLRFRGGSNLVCGGKGTNHRIDKALMNENWGAVCAEAMFDSGYMGGDLRRTADAVNKYAMYLHENNPEDYQKFTNQYQNYVNQRLKTGDFKQENVDNSYALMEKDFARKSLAIPNYKLKNEVEHRVAENDSDELFSERTGGILENEAMKSPELDKINKEALELQKKSEEENLKKLSGLIK